MASVPLTPATRPPRRHASDAPAWSAHPMPTLLDIVPSALAPAANSVGATAAALKGVQAARMAEQLAEQQAAEQAAAERRAERVRAAADALRHIPSLDGLRALSVTLVFIAHAGLEKFVPGGFGVTIFFFLSGFLITTLMRVEYRKNGHINLKHFYLRRVLRILPPFYLVLIVTSIAGLLFDKPGSVQGAAVAAQSLQVTNYWLIFKGYAGQPEGTGIYWSLAVEEHFYLVFPWLYIGMRRANLSRRDQAYLLWGLCALILVWRAVLVHVWHVPIDRTYFASDTRVDSILFGCALAVWRNPVLDHHVQRRETFWKWVLVPAAVAVLIACLFIRDPAFRETLRYSLQGAALTVIFVAAIKFKDWLPFRVLNWRPVAFIGLLSYSLYLVHYAVIFAVERLARGLHPLIQALIAAALSIAISWAIYRLIEKPCARLRKRLTD